MPKTIVITGASRGMGFSIAQNLLEQGNKLFLIASRAESFTERVPGISYLEGDFSSLEAIDEVITLIKNQTSHIDVLVNNLGIYHGGAFASANKADFLGLLDVNFRGPAYFTQQLLPLLQQGSHPQIISTSSIAVKQNIPNTALYTASKYALTGFHNALRTELNLQGIRLTVLHPAAVNTWNATETKSLLHVNDVAKLVKFIIDAHPKCQIEEVTLSPVDVSVYNEAP